MAYVTYDYYSTTYGGSAVSSSEFTLFELKARTRIDALTFGRLKKLETIDDTVKNAVCAVIDLFKNDITHPAVSSESAGKVSYTYVKPKSLNEKISNALKEYLWDTGYLYRGYLPIDYE